MVACLKTIAENFQPDPVTPNQVFMLGEVRRFQTLLDMGEFVAAFTTPPNPTYAGWAACQQGGRPPWHIFFNFDYVETRKDKTYMTGLVAHEMCHEWVANHGGNCYDEVAAETCAYNLVTFGRPK
jgi:hypothetical protein